MRATLLLGVLALMIGGSGCSMCCSPYDYCGPVVDSYDHGGEMMEGEIHEGPIEEEYVEHYSQSRKRPVKQQVARQVSPTRKRGTAGASPTR